MKCKIVLAAFLMMWGIICYSQTFNVASFNLRYDNPDDGLDRWSNRVEHVASVVRLYEFDVFGTQEGLSNQLKDLQGLLSDYKYFGVAREDGKDEGEHSAVFYNSNRFKLLDHGDFWLSETPDKPGLGWDAACVRICTWGKFKDLKSGKLIYLFNAHFDHRGPTARNKSSELVLKKIEEIAGDHNAIFTGDLNFDESDAGFKQINSSGKVKSGFDIADFVYQPNGSFNDFGNEIKSSGRIDHIFVTNDFKVKKAAILTNTYMGRYPSDHFPVMLELEL